MTLLANPELFKKKHETLDQDIVVMLIVTSNREMLDLDLAATLTLDSTHKTRILYLGIAVTITFTSNQETLDLKGTVSQDFLLLVLFMNQFPPRPRVVH